MEFLKLTEDQKVLLESAHRYIDRRIKPLRKEYDNRPLPKPVAHEVLGELAELGFIGGTLLLEMAVKGVANIGATE
ncbi:MAG: acyl-CoA dehydrogenase family protein [Candidatus Binataceae bacterium]|jgi:alkylation response protein AidB-like acyl-CoA dehydrogenase